MSLLRGSGGAGHLRLEDDLGVVAAALVELTLRTSHPRGESPRRAAGGHKTTRPSQGAECASTPRGQPSSIHPLLSSPAGACSLGAIVAAAPGSWTSRSR